MAQDEGPKDPAASPRADTGAWDIVAYLLSGMLVWGGAGWLLDRWLGTSFLVALGILLGAGLSTYAVFRRYGVTGSSASDQQSGESDSQGR
jgi:F0F1-type ATP synthase assembly protein I